MKNSNLSISNLTRKRSKVAAKVGTEVEHEVPNKVEPKRSEAVCKVGTLVPSKVTEKVTERLLTKVPSKIASKVAPKVPPKVPTLVLAKVPPKNLPKAPNKLPTMHRDYTPKIRQQVISNKLLNSKLYELYTVRKLHCEGAWLKANITDGTITIAGQTYIVAWLDVLPIDAYKEEIIVISLRTSKYKDSRTGEYPHSYAVVSKIVE